MKKTLIIALFLALSLHAGSKRPISNSQIPKDIKVYVDKNFPDTKIVQALKDKNSGEIKIILKNGVKIDFGSNNQVVDIYGRGYGGKNLSQNLAKLPQTAKDYVKKEFPKSEIVDIDIDDKIEVELDNGIEIDFDKDGNVLKVDR
ncbi:PepSY-like domain-containing protein [Campylobacter geochelonis]|uniref:PepSY-like domain-containing protein n=1 Tax=Campylobacter geochelonis TaxID=1780362 RepID=UPI00077097D6|nr:PepSY-like domain-containing protein [Campylobacter geochelonis]CZE46496.1 Protein of uncharacterised function (DUF2874) [Campylobacter geochelonis]CZE50447.1 Protein of uncharacterised function (DUF2874) [Campylobacter geochelonis]